jgi:D-3-phosphoglycerate dehydrogenase
LHVPLVDLTTNLISASNLKYFKKGAKLINLSRGGIVNSNDVIQALDAGLLSRFVTDFPTPELIKRSSDRQDVILLPHLGASTKEAEVNCAVMAANQLANFLIHGTIVNSVNFPSIYQERSTSNRLVVINRNEPGMISQIADLIASLQLNIADMTNKSRDEIAINIIDLEDAPSDELLKQLRSIDHVLKVRSIPVNI